MSIIPQYLRNFLKENKYILLTEKYTPSINSDYHWILKLKLIILLLFVFVLS